MKTDPGSSPDAPGGAAERTAAYVATVPLLYRALLERALGQGGYISPRDRVKAMCLQCSGFQRNEITHCTVWRCPLHLIRPYQGEPDEPAEGELQ